MPLPPYAVVWALVVLAWISNYLIRMAFPALLPVVMAELRLSYAQAGVLASAAFFLGYGIVQMPAGVLGDRFGRRRVLLFGLVAGALASAATGIVGSFVMLLLVRILTGASQGCLFSNDRAIIAAVTPRDRIALGQAVSFTGPGLGITIGLLVAGLLGEVMPWRHVFVVFAVPPLLMAVLIGRYVPAAAQGTSVGSLRDRLWAVLLHRDVWMLGLGGLAVMWVGYVFATWAPLLLLEVGVREPGRAAVYSSFQGVAAVSGLLAGGWLGDRARRRGFARELVVAGALLGVTVVTLAVALVVARGGPPSVLMAGLMAVSFLGWAIWGPSFAVLGEVFTGRELSTAFGVYNTVCVAGAVVGPALMGWTRDVTGSFTAGCLVSAMVALGGGAAAMALRAASLSRG